MKFYEEYAMIAFPQEKRSFYAECIELGRR